MKTKKIIVTSLLLAVGTILSLLKLFELPFGGTVTIASMVPIVLIAYIYGAKWGLFSAFVYSLLQLILGIGGGIVSTMFLPGEGQMILSHAITICLLDYILAYVALGLGGIFKGRFRHSTWEIVLGVILALGMRYLIHTVSGFIFYGAWAEWFFADSTGLSQITVLKPFCRWIMKNLSGKTLALFYSIVYNGAYMIPEIIITAILSPVVWGTVKKSKVV